MCCATRPRARDILQDIFQGYAVLTCCRDTLHGHVAKTCCKDTSPHMRWYLMNLATQILGKSCTYFLLLFCCSHLYGDKICIVNAVFKVSLYVTLFKHPDEACSFQTKPAVIRQNLQLSDKSCSYQTKPALIRQNQSENKTWVNKISLLRKHFACSKCNRIDNGHFPYSWGWRLREGRVRN